jgi:hypothetical protein
VRPGPRTSARQIARQKEQQKALTREIEQEERREEAERRDRVSRGIAEREQRDAQVRKQAQELSQHVIAARREAEDLHTDFEMACAALAAGTGSLGRAQSLQHERDEARRLVEIYGLAAGELAAEPALAGRR